MRSPVPSTVTVAFETGAPALSDTVPRTVPDWASAGVTAAASATAQTRIDLTSSFGMQPPGRRVGKLCAPVTGSPWRTAPAHGWAAHAGTDGDQRSADRT